MPLALVGQTGPGAAPSLSGDAARLSDALDRGPPVGRRRLPGGARGSGRRRTRSAEWATRT